MKEKIKIANKNKAPPPGNEGFGNLNFIFGILRPFLKGFFVILLVANSLLLSNFRNRFLFFCTGGSLL